MEKTIINGKVVRVIRVDPETFARLSERHAHKHRLTRLTRQSFSVALLEGVLSLGPAVLFMKTPEEQLRKSRRAR